jgi:hypothetical protein
MPLQKTAMASCRTSPPLPTLGSTCTDPPAMECHAGMQRDRSDSARLTIVGNEIHE